MEEIRWGMIGCGDVTERKSAPAFNRIEHSSLVAVMSRTAAKAEDYARRHAVPRWHASADALLNDPAVNAVYIATPPDSHMDYTIQAAQAGKPVYVEKPMARTYAECRQMIEACRGAGVPLFVAYYRRCLPAFRKVKQLVEDGAVGDVRFVALRLAHPPHAGDGSGGPPAWRVQPEVAGGGYFYDLGSHQFDYLDYLLGPVAHAYGYPSNQAGFYPAEDIVSASWRHESGVLGSGVWCFTVSPEQHLDECEIAGSLGKATFSFFDEIPVRLLRGGVTEEFRFPRQDPIQQPLIQEIVDELRGVGKASSTGESAARTNQVLETILNSA